MSEEKIIAVVVTYNRKNLVPQTLNALRAQTRPLDSIILIDNAATDGTPEVLREQGFLDDPLIIYVRLPTNTGGAGGFHEGMKRAMAAGADWIWVMDDDVVAASDCLEQLLKWRHVSECLHPKKFYPDGRIAEWEQFVDVFSGSKTMLGDISFRNGKEISFTNAACFEGMLVTRRIVSLAGLPDKKYFIAEDDTLFGVVASSYTNTSYVNAATMKRLLFPPKVIPTWRAYYTMRNRFFLFKDSCTALSLQLFPGTKPKFLLLRTVEVILSLRYGFRYFRSSLSGFVDGLRYFLRRP